VSDYRQQTPSYPTILSSAKGFWFLRISPKIKQMNAADALYRIGILMMNAEYLSSFGCEMIGSRA
jgi:hypothetical protein